MRTRRFTLSAAALSLSGGVIWAAYQVLTPAPPALAAWAPQGSLVAIEAKDFSVLLKDWSGSDQQRAWLSSDNYAEFSRSRLFNRLGEAQQQFAQSAGLPPDMNFLSQVAGTESLFAWYDIGKLEFLYITHLPASAARQTNLFQERSKFDVRQAAADTFYVRSTSSGDEGESRTVAFAVHGDYLLLATRQDLLASALLLMQGKASLALRDEHWYSAATAAASGPAGDLRMTLNLAAIVPSPYFRSYWVQQNITEMKQYSAAESDLYRTPESFREERVLLPKSPEQIAKAVDIRPVLAYLPSSAGVYRVTANPTTEAMVNALSDKLLHRDVSEFRDNRMAPTADLSSQIVGSAADLETRIDIAPLPEQPLSLALSPLRLLLDAAHVDAMLVTSTTASSNAGAAGQLFIPIHAALVLAGSAPWRAEGLQSALTEALQAQLTAGDNGLRWQPRSRGSLKWFEQQGLRTLAFAVEGNVCVLASDSDTLLNLLAAGQHAVRNQEAGRNKSAEQNKEAPQELVTVAAGFNHTAERAPLARIVEALDRRALSRPSLGRQTAVRSQLPGQTPEQDQTNGDESPDGETPAFFSHNIRSLSDTFQAMEAETFLERPDLKSQVLRQTVVYQWKH